MKDFMTAPPVILVNSTYPRDPRVKGIQFQFTCNLCPDNHKTQVWLCFLILSLMSTCTFAASVRDIAHLQICLNKLKPSIEKSDAMLYAPSANDVKENCKMMSLRCYMLELVMVFEEEEICDNYTRCIIDFSDTLPKVDSVDCPPCEAYSLKNITNFLERLSKLLKELTEMQSIPNT